MYETDMAAEALPIRVVPATPADTIKIYKFFVENFYDDEPMNKSLGRVPEAPDKVYGLDKLELGMSLMAVKDDMQVNPEIIGIALNFDVTSSYRKYLDEFVDKGKDEGLLKIVKLVRESEIGGNFWQRYSIDKAFHLGILAVHRFYRGRKIGRLLVEECMILAQKFGYPAFHVECSSYFSSRLMDLLEMTLLWKKEYKKHVDEKGEVVFHTKPPHEHFTLHVKVF